MKALIKAFLMVAIFAFSTAHASPFLICDPPPADQQVVAYNLYRDGVRFAENYPAEPDGSVMFDLEGITPGQYIFSGEAINVWGVSGMSDPYESPAPVGSPSGVGLRK